MVSSYGVTMPALMQVAARFRACYVAVALYTIGMVLLGAGFQNHLSIAAFIIGWGLVEIATIVNTTAVCEYPRKQHSY